MADPVGSLKQIAEVALKIKEAVETVRQNKEECLRIGRRVTRVSDILSQLQNTEMTNNPAMSTALDELDETLRHAHTLVTACQEKNIMCLFCTATKLSKLLRRVKDDIQEHLMEGIFATNVQVTIILTRIQDDDAHPLLAQTEETHAQQMQTLRSADAANTVHDDDAHPLLAQTEETHAQHRKSPTEEAVKRTSRKPYTRRKKNLWCCM